MTSEPQPQPIPTIVSSEAGPVQPSGTGAIEAGDATGQEEQEFETSDYESITGSDSTSVSSSIYAHSYENGRRYHRFRHGRYPLPNDDDEQNREDMKHAMMLMLTDGKLFLAPASPQSVLDIGTGTGIWCIDVGDRYPSASVTGLDLSPIQPAWVPPNVKFLVDDMEDDWLHSSEFDLIHGRTIMSIIKNPTKVLDSSYKQLKPGGWIELQEIHANAFCDDGTMPDDHPVKVFYELVQKAFLQFGTDIHVASKLPAKLEAAGFTNVQEKILKVPIGPWAKDKTLRLIGLYWRTAIQDLLPAMGGKPFLSLGLAKPEIEVFLSTVRKALLDGSVHGYVNAHFVYGQKPKQ